MATRITGPEANFSKGFFSGGMNDAPHPITQHTEGKRNDRTPGALAPTTPRRVPGLLQRWRATSAHATSVSSCTGAAKVFSNGR